MKPFSISTLFQGFAPPLKTVTKAVDTVKDDVKNASLPKDYGHVSYNP